MPAAARVSPEEVGDVGGAVVGHDSFDADAVVGEELGGPVGEGATWTRPLAPSFPSPRRFFFTGNVRKTRAMFE